jgi:hypothetical protein
MRLVATLLLVLAACASGNIEDGPDAPDGGGTIEEPMSGWRCAASRYDGDGFCDCECGAVDPDCANPNAAVLGCEDTGFVAPTCSSAGRCEDQCPDTPIEGTCLADGRLSVCFVGEAEAEILTQACPPGSTCEEDPFGARCEATGECVDGTTLCASDTQLKTCTGGAWLSSSCAPGQCTASPGVGAACTTATAVGNITGRVRYQARDRADDLDGYGDLETYDGSGVLVVVTDGADTLGSSTAGEDGSFSVPVSRNPSAAARVTFFPHLEDGDGETLYTVGRATAGCRSAGTCEENSKSAGAWAWAYDLDGASNVGTLTITEAEGSGALHIFEWTRYGLNRVRGLYGDSVPRSLLSIWEPGMAWSCGACFMNWPASLATSTWYDTSIVIGGEAGSTTHWSKSVLMHELGHWVMATYSKTPNEGGPHSVLQVSKPGLAWSEGWASYFGQTTIGEREGTVDPIYFDVQDGHAFWIDVEEVSASGGTFTMPTMGGGMTQNINEFVVSSMLWDLGDPASSGDPAAMGHGEVHEGIRTDRLRGSVNRGYVKVDLVDYLDGLLCDTMISSGNLSSVIRTLFSFPYDLTPSCGTSVRKPFDLEVGMLGAELTVRAVGAAPGTPPIMIAIEGVPVRGVGAVVEKIGTSTRFSLEAAPSADRPVKITARVLPGRAFGATQVVEIPARAAAPRPVATPLAHPIQLRRLTVTEAVTLTR